MYDIAIDRDTGDLMFGPTHDLIGATGPELTNQRIIVRCKIPRGMFSFDREGTLGSRLHTIQSSALDRQLREVPAIVQEALDPMTDIHVTEITPKVTDDNRLLVDVRYGVVVTDDEGSDTVVAEPEFDTNLIV